MFYEESLNTSNGYWYYRTTPTGEWIPFTEAAYCQRIARMQAEIDELRAALNTGEKP